LAAATRSPRRVQALARVQPARLEQAVAPFARAALLDGDQRLLDQTSERVGAPRGLVLGGRADALCGVVFEAPVEGGQSAQQAALVALEQVVAPLQGRGERTLPGGGRVGG